nr:immunoglobulin heavy chain junction region [Macaca mulatta]MOV51075.1 immunoglobulin heavy chain junction region [Macaca mulatta]MOV51561.1 immunoglobulin heavy chain junction region [Macaca mulatta]
CARDSRETFYYGSGYYIDSW